MTELKALVKRNVKLFFKDKGMFFTALITPAILLVLYTTFLGNVFEDSFVSAVGGAGKVSQKVIDGCVGGQLVSSLLAVSCVTVPFCSNMLMVQDKVNGSIKDITISPVKPSVVALAYYFATLSSSFIICFAATGLCLGYMAAVGFFMSLADVLLLLLDVFLLVMFGTALSSVINFFLSSQGQISAVGSVVSSVYGFICGAYMPISTFSPALQRALSFLPGTYATALMRTHAMRGGIEAMRAEGVPEAALDEMRSMLDCSIDFFGTRVSEGVSYAIVAASVAACIAVCVFLNYKRAKNNTI